jgi:kynurenine formamidase
MSPPSDRPPALDEQAVLGLAEELSNAGRWGPDDERGTLNHLGAASLRRGLAEIRDAVVISLGKELRRGVPGFEHHMLYQAHAPRASLDAVSVRPHGFEVTHMDALAHGFLGGNVYNGRRAEDVVTEDGLRFGAIDAFAGGVVTRGVLLDVAAAVGLDHLAPGQGIGAADLDRAESAAGTRVEPGDALFVRTGLDLRIARTGADPAALPREGYLPDVLRWLHERQVAVLCGDCVERLPSGYDAVPMPLHQIGLSAMGLAMIDGCDLELLASECRSRDRSAFLLAAAPLRIRGATGSPLNPLVVL